MSLAERLVPRTAASLIMIGLAAVATPHDLGLYAWGALSVTAYRAVSDQAVRQVAVAAQRSRQGTEFLNAYKRWSSWIGTLIQAVAMGAIAFSAGDGVSDLLALAPMIAVPAIVAPSTISLASLQADHQWSGLASAQMRASFASLIIAAPVLFLTSSILGATVQAAISEFFFTLLVIRTRRRLSRPRMIAPSDVAATKRSVRAFKTMSAYSGLGWAQAQADRLLMGAIVGTYVLGQYSLGVALGRGLGEAVAAGTTNVLRASLDEIVDASESRRRQVANAVLERALVLATVGALVTTTVVVVVLEPLLGPEWSVSLAIVPILAVSALPSTLAWSCAALHVNAGSGPRALLSPTAGIVMAVPIALSAQESLQLAAWLAVSRDLLVALVGFALIGRAAPWRALGICAGLVAGLSAVVLVVPSG